MSVAKWQDKRLVNKINCILYADNGKFKYNIHEDINKMDNIYRWKL